MTKTLSIFIIVLFAFSCKKTDHRKNLEVANLKDISSGQVAVPPPEYTINSKTVIASTYSTINDIVVTNGTLFLVGNFNSLGSANSRGIVTYNGSSLQAFSNSLGSGSNIRAINYFSGSYVIGGSFNTTTSSTVRYLGRIQGSSLTTFSTAVGQVYSLYSNSTHCHFAGNVTSANGYSTSVGRLNTGFSVLGSYYNSLGSSFSTVYAMKEFNNHFFLGGSLSSTSHRNIVYYDGGWQKSGYGFNNVVYDLIEFNGKLFAGGAMSFDGNSSFPMNYINQLSAAGSYWQKAGNNNVPFYCFSLEVQSNQLLACGSFGSTGYIYKYKSNAFWENCLGSGVSLKPMQKIVSYNGTLYGLEKDNTTGQTSFVRFN